MILSWSRFGTDKSIKGLVIGVALLSCGACGVKGDPIPPQTPPNLGRGEPTYRRATEEFAFPDIPGVHDKKESEEK